MNTLINSDTKIIVQGITGKQGTIHANNMLNYGTHIVAGVTPGKGGKKHIGLKIYDTVLEAKNYSLANTSIIFVPAPYASDAILEAIDAKIDLIICVTEGISVLDMLKIKNILQQSKTKLIGPNSPGIILPGISKIGIMPSHIYKKGSVGIISRSGTLMYESVSQISNIGLGQSICIGIGGDIITGSSFIDYIEILLNDSNTKAILIIGEIGGSAEEDLAMFIRKLKIKKPIFGIIVGVSAPEQKKMGHAGAIIHNGLGNASKKIEAFKNSGIIMIDNYTNIGKIIKDSII